MCERFATSTRADEAYIEYWNSKIDDSIQSGSLRKILMISAALSSAAGDYEKAKAAVDYAIDFPDYVRYSERGHGQILEEIKSAVQSLAGGSHREFAIWLAQYAIERAEEIAANFEDDWEWRYSLEGLAECVDELL